MRKNPPECPDVYPSVQMSIRKYRYPHYYRKTVRDKSKPHLKFMMQDGKTIKVKKLHLFSRKFFQHRSDGGQCNSQFFEKHYGTIFKTILYCTELSLT